MASVATKRRWSILLFAALLPATLFYPTAAEHTRAASLLLRLENSQANYLTSIGGHTVQESMTKVPTGRGNIPARLYTPEGVANAPGMVIIHGIHHLGMDEPRLVALARAFSAAGVTVLTPQISDLADYRVTPQSIDQIGDSAIYLNKQTGHPAGIFGISFAGGLALNAATDDRYAPHIAFVVAVGAHHDMARVARFLATGQAPRPDGTIATMLPHEYGALVLVYSFLDRFFSPEDIANAREAIRLLLYEDVDGAKRKAAQLSPGGRARMDLLFARNRESIRKELLAAIEQSQDRFAWVSPRGRLSNIHVPVLVLHGTGDEVIPATESLWLAQEIPQQYLRAVLISPAITHVEVGGEPGVFDKFALVHFISEMLHEANVSARR